MNENAWSVVDGSATESWNIRTIYEQLNAELSMMADNSERMMKLKPFLCQSDAMWIVEGL